MFNWTCEGLTKEQILLQAHKAVAIAPMIILYVVFALIFLLFGMFSIDAKKGMHPYKKFIIIWLLSTIFAGGVLAFLIASPNTIQIIINFFTSLWD